MSITDPSASRRDWLRLAALVAGAAGCIDRAQTNDAGTDGNGSTDGNPDGNFPADAAMVDTGPDPADAPTLNTLLAAEYSTIAAYTAGAGILAAPPADDPLAALAPTLLQIAARWLGQHQDHANALRDAVIAVGATPVDPADAHFVAPAGFTASVTNVLKLACNAEKSLALIQNHAVGVLDSASHRYLASVIQGDETQHFVVLYVILRGTAAPGPLLGSNIEGVVPTSFVSSLENAAGLDTIADLAFGAG